MGERSQGMAFRWLGAFALAATACYLVEARDEDRKGEGLLIPESVLQSPAPEQERGTLGKILDSIRRTRNKDAERQRELMEGLFDGLPETLPPDYPQRAGFVMYGDSSVPGKLNKEALGNIIDIKGSKPNYDDTYDGFYGLYDNLFFEERWARVPKGASIRRDTADPLTANWGYPPGTEIMDRFFVKSEPKQLLEMRLLKLQPSGMWSFGLYKAVDGSSELMLHKEPRETFTFRANLPRDSLLVTMRRLDPQSCRRCHGAIGPGPYKFAGPVGFIPEKMQWGIENWARNYEKLNGQWPLAWR